MTPEERDRLVRLEAHQENMEVSLSQIAKDVTEIKGQANKWKGAFAVILGLGGVVGFFASAIKDWLLQ